MRTTKYAHIAKLSTLISFSIGTVLFLTYIVTNFEGLLTIGLLYLITAILVNLLLFITIVLRVIIIKEDRIEILKNLFLMLINIPIAYLYAYIVFL